MLEYAVRPYQTPDAQGRIIIPSTPSSTRERATLKWGAQSTLPPNVFAGVSVACCKENSEEQSRQGETVRIHGTDGESYVDVFRATELKLKKKTDTAGCSADDPFGTYADGSTQTFSDSLGGDWGDFSSDPISGTAGNCNVDLKLHNNTTGT